jgi:hypothetical protein
MESSNRLLIHPSIKEEVSGKNVRFNLEVQNYVITEKV